MPPAVKSQLVQRLERMGARLSDHVRIDTTHFICAESRGEAWERARDLNVPVVLPEWLEACETEGRIVGVRSFYLDADAKTRQAALAQLQGSREKAGVTSPGASSAGESERPRTPVRTPTMNVVPPTPEQTKPPVPPKDESEGRSPVEEEDEEETEEEDDDEEDEKPKAKKQASVEDEKEGDSSFQDVAL
jgi:hypothetical protein